MKCVVYCSRINPRNAPNAPNCPLESFKFALKLLLHWDGFFKYRKIMGKLKYRYLLNLRSCFWLLKPPSFIQNARNPWKKEVYLLKFRNYFWLVFSQADHLLPAAMYVVLKKEILKKYFNNLRRKYFTKFLSRTSDEVVLIAIFTSWSPSTSHCVQFST